MKRYWCLGIIFLMAFASPVQAGKADVFPSYRLRSIPVITKKITENCNNDSLKTIAILQWMSEHLRYDWFREDRNLRIPVSAKKVNFRRKGDLQGYVNIFREMCRYAGVETEEINGYVYTDQDFHGQARFSSNQTWVMVRFNNKWHPISPYEVCIKYSWNLRFHRKIWKKLFSIPYIHDRHKHLQSFDTSKIYPDPQEFRKEFLPEIDYAQVLQHNESLTFFERHDSIYKDTSLAATKYQDESYSIFHSDPMWLQNYKSSKNILKVNPRNYFDASLEHVLYTINAKQPFLEGSEDISEQRDTLKFLIKEHAESQKLLRKAFQMNAEEAAYYTDGNQFRKKILLGGNQKNSRSLEKRKNQLSKLLADTKRLKETNARTKKNIEKTIRYLQKTKFKPFRKSKEASKNVHLKNLKKAQQQEADLAKNIARSDSILLSIDSLNQRAHEVLLSRLFAVYSKIDTLRKENIEKEKLNIPLDYEWEIYCRNDTIRALEAERKLLLDSLSDLRKKSIREKQNELRKMARVIQKNTEKQFVLLSGIPPNVKDSAFYNEDIHRKIYERAAHAYTNYLRALEIREKLYDAELTEMQTELVWINKEFKKMKKENKLTKQTYRFRKKNIRRVKKLKDKTIRLWQKKSRQSKKRQSIQLQKINEEIRAQKKDKKSGDDF